MSTYATSEGLIPNYFLHDEAYVGHLPIALVWVEVKSIQNLGEFALAYLFFQCKELSLACSLIDLVSADYEEY